MSVSGRRPYNGRLSVKSARTGGAWSPCRYFSKTFCARVLKRHAKLVLRFKIALWCEREGERARVRRMRCRRFAGKDLPAAIGLMKCLKLLRCLPGNLLWACLGQIQGFARATSIIGAVRARLMPGLSVSARRIPLS